MSSTDTTLFIEGRESINKLSVNSSQSPDINFASITLIKVQSLNHKDDGIYRDVYKTN